MRTRDRNKLPAVALKVNGGLGTLGPELKRVIRDRAFWRGTGINECN